MKLIFVGVQASGKGTQAKIIASRLNLKHISTGDLLRSATGELKQEIDSYINKGNLVPDELILRLLKEKLPEDDFILDGFPRNKNQVKELEKITKIDYVVYIEISDETARKRLSGRWNCKKCGIAYNIVTMPRPRKEGFCDNCNLPLFQRQDDIDLEAVNKRLKIYHDEINVVIWHYPVIKINGEVPIEQVTQEILAKLSN